MRMRGSVAREEVVEPPAAAALGVASSSGRPGALDILATLQSIHQQLDIVLVQHALLTNDQLLNLARRIHYVMEARGLEVQNTWQ